MFKHGGMFTGHFGTPSYEFPSTFDVFDILTNGTNPPDVSSSLLYFDF
jgi:hypothetical protein